jgi:hypothetical protein
MQLDALGNFAVSAGFARCSERQMTEWMSQVRPDGSQEATFENAYLPAAPTGGRQ